MDSMYGSQDQAPVKAPLESDHEDEGEATAVIDNKVLSPEGEPLKEGDEIVVQVVKNYGDESEIKYAPKKGGESEGGEGMGADAELDSMSEKGRAY